MTNIDDTDEELAAHIRRTLTAVAAATAVEDAKDDAGAVAAAPLPLLASKRRHRSRRAMVVGAAVALLAGALVASEGLPRDLAAVEANDPSTAFPSTALPSTAFPPDAADLDGLPVDEALASGSVEGVSDWWLLLQADLDGGSDCATPAMTLALATWHRGDAEGLGIVSGLGYGDRRPSGVPFAHGGCPDETAWLADPTLAAVSAGRVGTTPYRDPVETDADVERRMAGFAAYIYGAVHPSVTQVAVSVDGAEAIVLDTVAVPERSDGPRAFATTATPGSQEAVLTMLDASGHTVTEETHPIG